MKRILLFASAFALLTGCSKLEQAPESPINQKVDGIVFQASLGTETKGELYQDEITKKWKMFWYADKDKMSVYHASISDPNTPAPTWEAANVKTYKATRTLGEGYFAAEQGDQVLNFTPGENLSFRFVYPSSVDVLDADDNQLKVTLPNISAQTQTKPDGSDVVSEIFMTGKLDNVAPVYEKNPTIADNLVGNLKLARPFPVAYFKLKNYDADLYGNLVSITLESLGTKDDTAPSGYDADKASTINYGEDAIFNLETGEVTEGSYDASNAKTKLVVSVGAAWEDDAPIYMMMNTVDRSKNTKAEWMKVTYEFANATFIVENELKVNGSFEANELYNMSKGGAFDLAAEDYAVLGSSNATLLLNKTFNQSIESIVDENNEINGVNLTNIDKIVANSTLSDDDFTYLGENFTLAEVTLNENTAIPAFEATGTITKLVAPKVTLIDESAFENATLELTHCILPSYDFANVAVRANLLKKGNLTHLDISGVGSIASVFPAGGFVLKGFNLLEEVTLKPGVNLGANAFEGCTVLKDIKFPAGTVAASINLTGGNTFASCVALTKISISNTDIPAGAFSGCTKLASVTLAGQAIVPTTIGAEAFKGTAIVDMDLSKATEIGASAFENCKVLKGTKQSNGAFVLFVDGVAKLNDKVFSGCEALKYVRFANVETVGNDFLAGTTCAEISFMKPIAATVDYTNTSFGTTSGTILYVANGQKGVSGKVLTLASGKAVTFGAIEY